MKQTMPFLALLAAALLLTACSPRPAVTAPQAAAPGSTSSSAPAASAPALDSATLMMLQAGFEVPKNDVTALNFTLKSLDGRDVSLASFRGKLVFLCFWATWCAPFKAELPSLEALYEKLKDKGFTVLAIDDQEDNATVSNFVLTRGMTFPVLLDTDGEVGNTYQAKSLPTSFILSRDGKVLARIVGFSGVEWTIPQRMTLFQKLLSR